MKKIILLSLLTLGACSRDDITCRNQGNEPGTNTYHECRDSITSQRNPGATE